MALCQSATKGNAVGESITSDLYPLENPDPSLTDTPQTRYMEGPRPPCGFLYPTVDQILVPLLALRTGQIPLLAFRGYWRLTEMKMRRCDIKPGTPTHYPPFELQEGIGTRVRRRQAEQVRETLQETGLVIWTEQDIWLPTQLARLPWVDHDAYAAMREKVAKKLRRVPIHRSVMRWAIREESPSVIGTILSVALRCLRYNGKTKTLRYAGGVPAGWIEDFCGFSERTAYRDLNMLEALGFLRTAQWQPRWHQKQVGPWRIVARDWAPPKQRPQRPQQLSLPLPTETSAPARAAASLPSILANAANVLSQVEDGCKNLSPQACTNLAVSEDHNHNKNMDLHPTYFVQPLREREEKHQEPAPDVAPTAVPPIPAAVTSSPVASGVCHDAQKKPETSPRPPDMDALEATYTALPPEAQATLRAQAEAVLIQQGTTRDFLVWPVILSTIGCLLETQETREALGSPTLATNPFPPRTSAAGGSAEALASHAPAAPMALRSDRKRKGKPPAPTLRHILLEDLQDNSRLLVLLDEARQQGLIGQAPADRLTFCAMAAHALRVGEDNPCGLFCRLLHDDTLRRYLSDADDEAARVRLNAHEYGVDERRGTPIPLEASEPPPLSKDAWCVRELQRDLARQGVQVDVLEYLHQQDPARWTDEHCQTIARELAHYQHTCQQATALRRLGKLGMQEEWQASPFPDNLECAACGEEGPACACRDVEDNADG
jgi:hypothetical protein